MKKLIQSDAFKNFGSSVIAILIGLLIGAVVIFLSNSRARLNGLRTLWLAGPIGGWYAGNRTCPVLLNANHHDRFIGRVCF